MNGNKTWKDQTCKDQGIKKLCVRSFQKRETQMARDNKIKAMTLV